MDLRLAINEDAENATALTSLNTTGDKFVELRIPVDWSGVGFLGFIFFWITMAEICTTLFLAENEARWSMWVSSHKRLHTRLLGERGSSTTPGGSLGRGGRFHTEATPRHPVAQEKIARGEEDLIPDLLNHPFTLSYPKSKSTQSREKS